MASSSDGNDITRLLEAWSQGDDEAFEQLMLLVFDDLRQIANRQFEREPLGHTLQPTAVVNEVYMRLVGQRQLHWDNRKQFFAFAATLVRRVLVDHARKRQTAKRGGDQPKISFDEAIGLPVEKAPELIALDDALATLEVVDPRAARFLELHVFTGLSLQEIAEVEGVSLTTVKRELRTARIWLLHELERA